MGSTAEHLAAAFAGESQANRRYLAFSEKAEEEGYTMVARLFRAAAAAETIHAHNHLRAMHDVADTATNLDAAMEGEAEEFRRMYPDFVEVAKTEGDKEAARTFDYAMQVEKIHYDLYGKAASRVKEGNDLPYANVFVCRGCGNTEMDSVPDNCPICGAPKSWFMWIQ